LCEETGAAQQMEITFLNLCSVNIQMGKYDLALEYDRKALRMAEESGNRRNLQAGYLSLSTIYEETRNYGEALKAYKRYVAERDSLINEANTKKTVQMQMQYEFDRKEEAARLEQEKKDALASAEARKQRIVLFSVSGLGLLILIFAVFAWRSFLQKKKANEEIIRQKHVIEEKQKEILDSIRYAKRIQNSLLPTNSYLVRALNRGNHL
jgi:tetratricopeptide (TPR) repeat protein